jgi:hypothetical protein
MQILVSIDDTDNLDSRGTGELADLIAKAIENMGYGTTQPVSRHQLLIHEDIPYTSHNSAMCFSADVNEAFLEDITQFAANFLEKESAEGSDPGLCIVKVDLLDDKKRLIDFGYKAKKIVLVKEIAYSLAKELNIHLSEHGGTGQGVIGALAGAGLRLSGNDGKHRGSHKLDTTKSKVTVSELCSNKNIDKVKDINGAFLKDDEIVMLKDKIKTVIINRESVLLVEKVISFDAGISRNETCKWTNCTKQQIKDFEELRDGAL